MAATVGRYPVSDIFSFPSPPLFHRSRSTPCLPSSSSSNDQIACVEISSPRNPPAVHELVRQTSMAMAAGARPVPANSGICGAFFLPGNGDCVAVIKPVETHLAVREAAAYLLDHAEFAGVPPTALIRITHPAFSGGTSPATRIASIQRFLPHDFDAGNLGPSKFTAGSVHRIGILDIRLLNTDRHAGNLLVQKQMEINNRDLTTELVPIDHGLCLPEMLEDPYFEWLHWPQASMPFSHKETEYVSRLDPFRDAELLRSELPLISEPAIRVFIICTIFLKKGVAGGLCLSDIGGMMTREFRRIDAGESVLEALCRKTEEAMAGDDIPAIPPIFRSGRKKSLNLSTQKEEKMGNLMKSLSFPAREMYSGGNGGIKGSKSISFMSKSKEEWKLFLERFERILTEAIEARKKTEMNCRF